MNHYTGKEYLYIDIANTFGLDKLLFEKRIEWVECNEDRLESMVHLADEKPLFMKAVMTLRKAQKRIATGHMVSLDACASGTQIMSAVTGCIDGARATGLVDPNKRADAYTDLKEEMNTSLQHGEKTEVIRGDAKDAFMKFLYGSEAEPKKIFGEFSPAYRAFFPAVATVAPGAYALRDTLIDVWQPYVDQHIITMPDGFEAVLRVSRETTKVIEVDELNHATFSHIYKEYMGTKTGLSLAANGIHEIDGMVVREMNRRCNFKSNQRRIESVFMALAIFCEGQEATDYTDFLSLRAIEMVDLKQLAQYDFNMLCRLRDLCKDVLFWKPAPLVCNHDAFKSLPNHMNKVRYWYKEILAELADSNILQDMLREITGDNTIEIQKLSEGLGDIIRQSNYALS